MIVVFVFGVLCCLGAAIVMMWDLLNYVDTGHVVLSSLGSIWAGFNADGMTRTLTALSHVLTKTVVDGILVPMLHVPVALDFVFFGLIFMGLGTISNRAQEDRRGVLPPQAVTLSKSYDRSGPP